MISLEKATEIGRRVVEDAGYVFDRIYLVEADEDIPALYFADGKDDKGQQAISGIEIKKAILAEDGSIIDFELQPPGMLND